MARRPAWMGLLLALVAATQNHAVEGLVRLTPVAPVATKQVGFTRLESAQTGITFTNELSDLTASQNQIRLNGSGVAAGDVDGDGRCDLYFCGLDGPNALYRNLGGWRFENITKAAGVEAPYQFATGALLADVDGDGDLDLLVTAIGSGARLFLNDGKARFTEAVDSGLRREGGSTSMAMGDIDGDGDLDLYVANYRRSTVRSTGFALLNDGVKKTVRPEDREDLEMTPQGLVLEHGEPDVLYENKGGKFTAVPFEGGRFLDEEGRRLTKAPHDWGLSVMMRDINGDGAPDIYVCNDFHSPDRVWLNDGKGGFRAIPKMAVRSNSTFSMGVDFADINRDGADDFMVLDMLDPDRRRRMRQVAGLEPPQGAVGVYGDRPQYGRNMLQMGRGDGTFFDAAWFAGVEAAGWSWCPVFLDVDLDGYEDLLVTAGNMFDTQDLDAAARISALGPFPRDKIAGKLLLHPRLPLPNRAFRNGRDGTFKEMGAAWGFDFTGVSHGMVTADLDNDGDLDVVHNLLNGPAGVYRNESGAPRLAVRLKGLAPNTQGIGARMIVEGGPVRQTQEVIAGGRYLSGAEPLRVFAARDATRPLTVEIAWRSGARSKVTAAPNHICEISEPTGGRIEIAGPVVPKPIFREMTLMARQVENEFDDFARQPLLPWKLSQAGPGVSWLDINADGWEDLLATTGRGGRMTVLTNDQRGGFGALTNAAQKIATRDQTMIVGAAGLAFVGVSNYEDGLPAGDMVARINVHGEPQSMFAATESAPGPMCLADLDGDGDLDLFIGGRVLPGRYPEAASSRIYRNNDGKFELDAVRSKPLEKIGLVTAAVCLDVNGDGRADLLVALEWGSIRLFLQGPDGFRETTEAAGLAPFKGLWQGMTAADLDADGDQDIVVANWGLNTPIRASREHPKRLYFGDFDESGTFDILETSWDRSLREEATDRELNVLAGAMPELRERFPSFASYAAAPFRPAFAKEAAAGHMVEINTLESGIFWNDNGRFRFAPLPQEAQMAPAFGVATADFDGDGTEDIVLAQNLFALHAQTSRLDAGRGLLLLGDGAGGFHALDGQRSGVMIYGEQRGCAAADFDHDGRVDLAIGQNGAELKLLRNETARPGLRVRLQGTAGNPAAIGAVVRARSGGGAWGKARELRAGGGWLSQDDVVQVFAGPSAPTAIQVRWPGGKLTEHPVAAGASELLVRQ